MKEKIFISAISLLSFGSIPVLSTANIGNKNSSIISAEEFTDNQIEDITNINFKSNKMGIFDTLFKKKSQSEILKETLEKGNVDDLNYNNIYKLFLSFPNIWNLKEEDIPSLSQEDINRLKQKADQGDAESQFIYGFNLMLKAQNENDYKTSTAYLQLAAKQGEPLACFILGQFFENGSTKCGIEQDVRDAYEYFLKSAQKNYAPAKYCLGYFHEFIFLFQDYDKALFWYESALNDGYQEASQRLSWLKQTGAVATRTTTNERLTEYFNKGFEYLNQNKEKEAARWFLKAACQGIPGAIRNVAHALTTGQITSKRDQETITKLLLISYDRFDSGELLEIAKYFLIELHKNNIGLEQINSNPHLLLNLGLYYAEKGQISAAKEIWEKSAALGNSDAMANLAIMHERGIVVAQNYAEAFRLATKAKEIDQNGFATKILASYYLNGWGTPKNESKALVLFEESANKGFVDSMNFAANCYFNGIGTAKDTEKAIEWWEKAAAHGNEQAREFLQELEKNNK